MLQLVLAMAVEGMLNESNQIHYCPWADTVVELELIGDQVRLASGRGNVPKPGLYGYKAQMKTIGAATVPSISFSINEVTHVYSFEVKFWEDGGTRIRNINLVVDSGDTFKSGGLCFDRKKE